MTMTSRCVRPSSVTNLSRLFDEFFNDSLAFNGAQAVSPTSLPLAMDISEDATQYIVRASLPGYTREEVDVQAHDGVLTIKAGKVVEKTEATPEAAEQQPTERFLRRERYSGRVARSVTLPENFNPDRIAAELKDGVLTIRLPKAEHVLPRKISVN